jgi:cytoskeletal protein RodZ
MQSIGDILREKRHARQISLEEAARATKVKVDILEKLEADEYGSLPGVTYTRGFLKIYAEHLGLDSQSIVDAFIKSQGGLRRDGVNLETEATHRARKPAELQLSRRTLILAVASVTVVVVIGAVATWWLSVRDHNQGAAVSTANPVSLHANFDAVYAPKDRPVAPVVNEPPAME